jgi:protein SCO1/2
MISTMKSIQDSTQQPDRLRGRLRRTVSAVAIEILTLIGIALLIASLQLQGGQKYRKPEKAAPATTEPKTTEGQTEEYDYDPPLPGTYKLPVLQEASNGTVVAPDGKPVNLHELLDGRIAILSFIYTRCADPKACLRASGVLSQLQQMSRNDKSMEENLRLITLSFDPGYDTPEIMGRYGRVFSSGEGGADWLFLTTRSYDDLRPLLEAYGQRVDKRTRPSALGPYQHTLRVYLIDSQKRIRNIYSYGLLDPRLVAADIKTLLLEESKIATN